MQRLYIFLSLICWARSDTKNQCLKFTDLSLKEAFMDIFRPRIEIKLMLYTRESITCARPLFKRNFILNDKFNPTKKTVWIVHGFRPLGTNPIWLEKLIKLLLSSEDVNIIVVDWNRGATTLIYQRAIKRTWKVAQMLKEYIKRMVKYGISLESFHFIGVSLGAHIAGYVGSTFNGLVGRITGIDPAGPGFNNQPSNLRLDHKDAKFVDVIHSDSNGLGITHSVGHIDFYPNGGKTQPGCPKSIFSAKCNLIAYPCNSYEDYRNGRCFNCEDFGLRFCPTTGYYADPWKNYVIKRNSPGLNAYFDTSPKEPFCLYHYVLDIRIVEEIRKKAHIEIKLTDKDGVVEKSKIKNDKTVFSPYADTHIVAGFYNDFKEISEIILTFIPKSIFLKCYTCKYQIHHLRLRSLNFPERPKLCKEKVVLGESTETKYNLHFCK